MRDNFSGIFFGENGSMEKMYRTIIGLTGPTAGGKGTVADFLKEKGFAYFSLSDEIRKESRKRGWSENERKVLQDLGDELRLKIGPDVWARRIATLNEFKHADQIVIDSIRHPAEAEYFKDVFDAKIIGITAPPEKLFERMRVRNRPGDPETFEEFLMLQEREVGVVGSSAMNVRECLKMADFVVMNDRELDDLTKGIEKGLKDIGVELRPYYLGFREHHH